MKVLVTGDRGWSTSKIDLIVEVLSAFPSGTIIVHGACRGVDNMSAAIAEELGFTVRPYPADWVKYGNAAGPVRNQQMIDVEHRADEPIDLCVYFHEDIKRSKGTKDCVQRANDAGIVVRDAASCVSRPLAP